MNPCHRKEYTSICEIGKDGLYVGAPARTFIGAVRICLFEKYFDFSGRASRSEFFYFYLFYLFFGLSVIVLVLLTFGEGLIGFVEILLLALFTIPFCSVAVRRLHDVGESGWLWLGAVAFGVPANIVPRFEYFETFRESVTYLAISLVGILVIFFILLLLVRKGDLKANQFG